MKWLWGYVLVSAAGAFLAVRIFDYLKDSTADTIAKTARAGMFTGVWTAITAASGMRGFTERVRGMRKGIKKRRSQEHHGSAQ